MTSEKWTAFQREREVGTNYWRILFHDHPEKQDIYGQDGLAGYCGQDRAHIAAAGPELLEALETILPWHDSHPSEATDNPVIRKCREAIAKARGRART
jgi:hypothetical protein